MANLSGAVPNTLVLNWGLPAGTAIAGTGVTLTLRAPRAANITTCKVTITTTDGSNAFQFRIKKNGTDIFSADPTIAAATTGIVDVSSSLVSSPLAVAEDDKFTLDILAGSATWALEIQLGN